MLKHLDHINLTVKNLDETVSWYARVFGFEVVDGAIEESVSWKIIKSGEAMLCLYEYPNRKFLGPDEFNNGQLHGIYHFALRITDREKWEKTIEREKIPVGCGGKWRWPHSDSWYIFDPTGYQIEVVLWDEDKVLFNREL